MLNWSPYRVGGLKCVFGIIWLLRNQVLLAFVPSPLQALVGSNGLGPSTSRLSGVCSNQLSYEPIYGGGNRVRTDDPLLAGQVLYQLSYTPIPKNNASLFLRKLAFIKNE